MRNKIEEERLCPPGDGVAVPKHYQHRLPPGLETVPGGSHVGRHGVVLQQGDQQGPARSSGLEERGGEGSAVGRHHLMDIF